MWEWKEILKTTPSDVFLPQSEVLGQLLRSVELGARMDLVCEFQFLLLSAFLTMFGAHAFSMVEKLVIILFIK